MNLTVIANKTTTSAGFYQQNLGKILKYVFPLYATADRKVITYNGKRKFRQHYPFIMSSYEKLVVSKLICKDGN